MKKCFKDDVFADALIPCCVMHFVTNFHFDLIAFRPRAVGYFIDGNEPKDCEKIDQMERFAQETWISVPTGKHGCSHLPLF